MEYFGFQPGVKKPAGCYTIEDTAVHFNSIVDPSLTQPDPQYGALCLESGTDDMLFITLFTFELLQNLIFTISELNSFLFI